MEALIERFLRYVKIDTMSDPKVKDCPSTPGQLVLAQMLRDELLDLRLEEVVLDQNGYVRATLPANTEKKIPVIGFLAHMDTSPDFSAEKVNPQFHSYSGGRIQLDSEGLYFLDPEQFPELNDLVGKTLITTDGHSLLGADDKAGIAEIMEAMRFFKNHPDIPHGTIKIGFTPDEEIGRGADYFPINEFGADYAYTLDGGQAGELEYENFNAAFGKIEITGRNVHPGTAKNKMINAMQLGINFHNSLPHSERPELTENAQGFYHLVAFKGTVEHATLEYIIRDHDRDLFDNKKHLMQSIVEETNKELGTKALKVSITDQYYNMREKIEPVFFIVDMARKAMEDLGIKPLIIPIRGGTDGARLSFMGLPTPNIFTGGYNYHGRYEFIPVESMKQATEVIIRIIQKFAL
ncbi:MAG: peptidase T [Bacteroidales bacterium]|nr:peptidase T [Bacteroidales bacterium]